MSRRWANVPIYDGYFNDLLRGREDASITSDWPTDATIIGGYWEPARSIFILTVESAMFDDIPIGNVLPEWTPTFTAHLVEPTAAMLIDIVEKMRQEELDDVAMRA